MVVQKVSVLFGQEYSIEDLPGCFWYFLLHLG